MYKIIGNDQQQYGPVPTEQLKQWYAEGRVNALTLVQPEGASDWKPLSSFPELMSSGPSSGGGTTDPLRQVQGPATGLLVAGILNIVFSLVGILFNMLGIGMHGLGMGGGNPMERYANMIGGGLGLFQNAIQIAVGAFVIFGALKMKKLENHGLVMGASIVVMLPCLSSCCLVGLPLGIWALVVLTKTEVKGAFH
jgi:hypothetical protein